MKPLFVSLMSLLLSSSIGNSQVFVLKEEDAEAKEILSRSFPTLKENVDLPPIQPPSERTYEHPYNFKLINDGSGNYYFGYNTFSNSERYESGQLRNAGTNNEFMAVKGQYIDRFFTKSGSIIVRTIGYTADDRGYRPFLIGISVEKPESPTLIAGGVGAPREDSKDEISSAALGSLIGGNPIG